MPLTNCADCAPPKRLASSTASSIATFRACRCRAIRSAQPQHVAVGGGHAVEAPIVGGRGDLFVQFRAMRRSPPRSAFAKTRPVPASESTANRTRPRRPSDVFLVAQGGQVLDEFHQLARLPALVQQRVLAQRDRLPEQDSSPRGRGPEKQFHGRRFVVSCGVTLSAVCSTGRPFPAPPAHNRRPCCLDGLGRRPCRSSPRGRRCGR